jgi:hypothetical protein
MSHDRCREELPMPRRRAADPDLPPLPAREKRVQQVKIRLTDTELRQLIQLRPDLAPSAIVALLVDDVLAGRHRPHWATPADEPGKPSP